MAKSTRQIRIEPEVELTLQLIADTEKRTFSSTCNWLLAKAAENYVVEHGLKNE